jgi:tellurite resistance protein TerC/cation:H+ antiporter
MSLEVRSTYSHAYRDARNVVISVVGSTVLAVGVVFIVPPGPAMIVIPTGLIILGTEVLWARRLLGRLKRNAGRSPKATELCDLG